MPHQVPLLYLDANVLLPAYLRAVFLDLADAGLVRVHWGAQVLVEVRRNLLKPKFGVTPEANDNSEAARIRRMRMSPRVPCTSVRPTPATAPFFSSPATSSTCLKLPSRKHSFGP